MMNAPVGLMDSGVGGLTVARAIAQCLPGESFMYVADSAHSPYGPQSIESVRSHVLAITDHLVAEGAKLLVIACNTATAAALTEARARYEVPVVGVIEPAVHAALRVSAQRRIGVLATEATVRSGVYQAGFEAVGVDAIVAGAPGLAELVEAGITDGYAAESLASSVLMPLREADVDTVVLGCTHYPFLADVIGRIMGPAVTLVDPAVETAQTVAGLLTSGNIAADADTAATYSFFTTGATDSLQSFVSQGFGDNVVTRISLEGQGV